MNIDKFDNVLENLALDKNLFNVDDISEGLDRKANIVELIKDTDIARMLNDAYHVKVKEPGSPTVIVNKSIGMAMRTIHDLGVMGSVVALTRAPSLLEFISYVSTQAKFKKVLLELGYGDKTTRDVLTSTIFATKPAIIFLFQLTLSYRLGLVAKKKLVGEDRCPSCAGQEMAATSA